MTHRRQSILARAEFGPAPAITFAHADSEDQDAASPLKPATVSVARISRRRKRFAALLAVIAVPAMAAPGGFGALAGDAPREAGEPEGALAVTSVMPFEQPGLSFPGSAFYYLADPPHAALVALPESDPAARGAAQGRKVGALIDAGPAAQPFIAGGGNSAPRAQACLAQAIWYEAASESIAGQRAVAQVVLNRVAHSAWPASVCGVVYQGSSRATGCQFSFTCDGSLARAAHGRSWATAQQIAREALSGAVYAPIGHATHYHTLWVNPRWAKSLDVVGTIGAHRFYRNRGSEGAPSAFRQAAYSGEEPVMVQAVTSGQSSPQGPEPQPISNAAIEPAHAVVRPTTASSQSVEGEASSHPDWGATGQARSDFARAGQWKVDPASLGLARGDAPASPDKPAAPAEPDEPGEPGEPEETNDPRAP
ncbi:MAG: cell wall hydrolase [Pseudomonadota bacterium]